MESSIGIWKWESVGIIRRIKREWKLGIASIYYHFEKLKLVIGLLGSREVGG